MNVINEGSVKDIEASQLSLSKNGILGIFYSRYDAMLINLNDHKLQVKASIGRKLKEISTCQWSKQGDTLAIGLNNVCKVYDCDMNKVHSLQGHNMPICSVDWHPSAGHQIISSSYYHNRSLCIWDIRKPDALIAWKDGCLFQKVAWHKFNTFVFGTSSDSDILLWDQRNVSSPTSVISAHKSYVADFNWLPREDYSVVSCGQYDQRIKFWNFSDETQPLKNEIEESSCMSHCKLNSSGNKLVTLTISENSPENQLILWDVSLGYEAQKLSPASLSSNYVVDFDWRILSADKHQIVSLRKDFVYKVWDVDMSIPAVRKVSRDNFIKRPSISNDKFYLSPSPLSLGDISNNLPTAVSETFAYTKNESLDRLLPRYSDSNLAQKSRVPRTSLDEVDVKIKKEFDKLTNNVQVAYEKNASERRLVAHLNLMNGRYSIMFSYQGVDVEGVSLEASFVVDKSDRLRKQNMEELDKVLRNAANKNAFAISKCIDVAIDYLSKLSSRLAIRSVRAMKESSSGSSFYSNLQDKKVPFPRSCGARFSPSGHLVCFLLPTGYQNKFHTTPRSFFDIVKHSNATGSGKDIYYGYNVVPNKTPSHRTPKVSGRKARNAESSGDSEFSSRMHSLTNLQKHNFIIYIYNTQRLSLFCPDLAKKYCINISDMENMCEQNAAVVADANRRDLSEFWHYCNILAKASRPSVNDVCSRIKPWPAQLLGKQMCGMWLDHFLKLMDVQSAAMLILVMMGIDTRFDADFEARYNYSVLLSNKKIMSQDSNLDQHCVDNTSITSLGSGVNIIFDGVKVYRIYDDRSNSAVIISDGSSEGHKRFYHNSFSEVEHQCTLMKRPDTFPEMILRHRESCRMIDPTKLPQYGSIMLHYARMLSAQTLLTAATKITRKVLPATFFNITSVQDQFSVRLIQGGPESHPPQYGRLDDGSAALLSPEYMQRNPPPPSPLTPLLTLSSRHQDVATKRQVVLCSICRLSVHGLLSLCALCHHGGHMSHITAWFARPNSPGVCPTGCGCQCAASTEHGLEPPQTLFT